MDPEEIKTQLQMLPDGAAVALAVRAGLRVLPWLAQQKGGEVLARWPENQRSKHLLTVMRAYEVGLLATFGEELPRLEADGRRAVAEAGAYAYAAEAAAATYSAAYFPADAVVHATDACYAAYAAVVTYSYDITTQFNFNLKHDLEQLRKIGKISILAEPLWHPNPPGPWERQLARFRVAVHALNNEFDHWLGWYDNLCSGNTLDVPLLMHRVFLPSYIAMQSPATINTYLENLAKKTSMPLNRVRTIFIGDGEAGKTSLIRVLHGEPVVEGIEPKTPGIAIREWQIPETKITASFWDFGGQVMVHATHQLFLRESCLYVLLVSAREKEKATERAEYWLEHVKSFGKGAPVLIVANKADKEPVRLDENLLMEKYPGMIQGFFQLSTTQAQGIFRSQFEQFKHVFCQQLQAVGLHQVQFQNAHFAVLQNLRQRTPKQAFLTHADYAALCNKQGIDDHGVLNSAWLLDILDKLGVIVHFPDMVETEEYILNPRWLTYGVYTIMYNDVARITRTDAVKLLGSKPVIDHDGNILPYPPTKCRIVFEAMRRYKLCYFLPRDPDQMIIPALLPSDIKQHGFDTASALEFHYQFESFLPRHLISELIVECHEDIANIDGQDIVWQHGVLLANTTHQTRALIQADYHFRRLSIWLTRGSNTADLLAPLRDRVERIVSRIDIKYQRNIRLPREALEPGSSIPLEAEWANFGQILAMRNRNQPTYFHESGSEYSIAKILGLFESKTGDTIINHNPTFNQNTTNIIKSKVGGNAVTSSEVKDSFNGPQPPYPTLPCES